ncbi:Secreted RxLR effector peptide protein [Phytophthora palmivora]|uniref:RxLR effector protein n=1 Tax=Phytophthora palmivora TaxID=4796 RepID=A0A2P4XUS2_9STRA|nr:Secreted RxLR effector peptide protein [Phytophthora palmivora]
MRLHYVMMVVAATLATVNGAVSEAKVVENMNFQKVAHATPINSIDTVQAETTSKRMLRGADTNHVDSTTFYYYPPKDKKKRKPFIEVRLQKALSNPKKRRQLYAQWYQSGFSPKQVAKGLDQSENKELDQLYRRVAKGYAVYVKGKRSQQQTM